MLLVADIGNTNITLGFFVGDEYVNEIRIPSDRDLSQSEYEDLLAKLFKGFDIDACVVGSVVNELNDKFTSAVGNVLNLSPLVVDNNVYTGVSVFWISDGKPRSITFSECTDVEVAEMSPDEIDWYVASGECDDKAGAYGIQGLFARFITGIKGDYYNVVGLPVARLYKELKEQGLL